MYPTNRECLFCQHRDTIRSGNKTTCNNPVQVEEQREKWWGEWDYPEDYDFTCKRIKCVNFEIRRFE